MSDYKQAFEVESRKTGAQQVVIGDLKDEIERLTTELERRKKWSTLDRAEDTFADFNLGLVKARHEQADRDKTCDFQTMHHDRKCLIEYAETLLTENGELRAAVT